MILDIFLLIFLFYLSIPTVVGYFAHCYGRSFWLWFGITCFLPILSHIVLYVLVNNDSKNNLVLSAKEEAYVMREVEKALNQPAKPYI